MVTVEEGMEVSRILNVQVADHDLKQKLKFYLRGSEEYKDVVMEEHLYSEEAEEEIDANDLIKMPDDVRLALVQIRAYCSIHKCGMWRLISM